MGLDDLYNMALRNGYYLPKRKSSAVNEVMLFNVLHGHYWCPKFNEIRLLSCPKPPLKEVLFGKITALSVQKNLNIAWIDVQHLPDKEWMVAVLATLDPSDEIFRKDYVAPPIRKRLRDIETIVLPNELFEGLPKSTSKVKARRLKIVSEALAAEKASRLKDMQKELYEQMVEQEEKVVKFHEKKKHKMMMAAGAGNLEEEEKKMPREILSS